MCSILIDVVLSSVCSLWQAALFPGSSPTRPLEHSGAENLIAIVIIEWDKINTCKNSTSVSNTLPFEILKRKSHS